MCKQGFTVPIIRGLAAVLAVVVPLFCLVIGAGPVHAADGGCPSSQSSPRFCAHAGGADQAVPVLVVTALPEPPAPERSPWVPVSVAPQPAVRFHAGVSGPRAPPLLPA